MYVCNVPFLHHLFYIHSTSPSIPPFSPLSALPYASHKITPLASGAHSAAVRPSWTNSIQRENSPLYEAFLSMELPAQPQELGQQQQLRRGRCKKATAHQGGKRFKRNRKNGLNGVSVSGPISSSKRTAWHKSDDVCQEQKDSPWNHSLLHHEEGSTDARGKGDVGAVTSSRIIVHRPHDRCLKLQSEELNYPYLPGLNDELALLCLARVPRSDYENFFFVNRKFCALAESGELYKIRSRNGILEQWVYMLYNDQLNWEAFDPKSRLWRQLPVLDADYCYYSSDKESFSVGTQLLVVGRHAVEGVVIWRYDLVTDCWSKGPMMMTPRCLYAWASCGSYAYLAGGITLTGDILKSAERYDPDCKRWEALPNLEVPRRYCAGCYLDRKFYVIGGENKEGDLTSGEVYDPVTRTWSLIPDMLPRGTTRSFPGAPPLIAVVKNELYILESESNQLKVYVKGSNTWRVLGEAPVRADLASGWGIAFKALGDELLVIGSARSDQAGHGDGMYTCKPDPEGGELQWCFVTKLGPFIFNCAIMAA